jgi:hypothetical protein
MPHFDHRPYLFIPYKAKGRTRAGLDCWGLVWLVYREQLCIELPRYAEDEYSGTNIQDGPTIAAIIEAEARRWIPIGRGQEQSADVAVFRVLGETMHTGLSMGGGNFLHCIAGRNVAVENYRDPAWTKRLTGFYRYAGFAQVSPIDLLPASNVPDPDRQGGRGREDTYPNAARGRDSGQGPLKY